MALSGTQWRSNPLVINELRDIEGGGARLVAAIVDHWLTTDRLPLPDWVRTPQRTLTEPWDVEPLASLRPAARKATPKAIARHGIYLAASEFASV